MQLSPHRDREIRELSHKCLVDLWRHPNCAFTEDGVDQFIRAAPELLIELVLDADLEEPEVIPVEFAKIGIFETAGFIDRRRNVIVVAQKGKPEWKRYTLAHEIGHWMLHPEQIHHRDRLLHGAERLERGRKREEVEADVFAAELLMPSKRVRNVFESAFGKRIDGRQVDQLLSERLSKGTGKPVSKIKLAKELRYRSFLVASTTCFADPSRHFVSLAEHFRVSPTAMGIQLEDLELVI